jgi:hypothetical protein
MATAQEVFFASTLSCLNGADEFDLSTFADQLNMA